MRKKEGFGLSSLIQTALPLSFMSSGFLRACHLVEALVASMAWRINLMRSAQFTGKRMQSDWMLFLIPSSEDEDSVGEVIRYTLDEIRFA